MNRLIVLLSTTVLLCGCYNPFDPPTNIVASDDTGAESLLAPAPQGAPKELPSRLTVSEALSHAWRLHPAMQRARRIIRAKHGYKAQAALWPNPVAGATFIEEPNKKTRGIVSLAQKFEIGGKADARVSLAAANVFLSEVELIETWSALRAEIKEAFVRLAYAQANAALTRRIAAADQERLDLAMGLFKAGKASESQTLKLTRQAARSKAAFDQSPSLTADATRGLLVAIGSRLNTKAPTFVCSLDVKSPLAGEFDALLKTAEATNPQLKTARAQTAVARAQLRLAKTKQWSDVTVGMAYYQTEYDTSADGDAFRASVSAPLPLWDRNQGNIAASKQNIAASERQRQLAALTAARQLSQLFSQRQRWLVELKSFDETIIPAAAREQKLIRDALAGGKASKLDAIKQGRELIALDLRKLELQLMVAVATIQLENITGLAAHDPDAPNN
ncbi:MAG: TolC family protein [Phycisphaerae bacterium]|jgi:cobalt-zinc-cadmium efflux system outer membrane protein|nr:TolC family protein [Phycisphaerae bacterium]